MFFHMVFHIFAFKHVQFFMKKLEIEEIYRLSLSAFRKAEKIPLVIVLDNIRSAYNVGSIFRTADAFRVDELLLCGFTAIPPSVEIHKTALGAEKSVLWKHFDSTLQAVEKLKSEGITIISLEQAQDSCNIRNFIFEKGRKYALVVGNEVKGVDQKVLDLSDYCLEIPQFGTKHSLNVSVAAGIAIWQIASQSSLF